MYKRQGAYRINGFKVRGQGYQSAMRKYKLEVKNHYIITLSTTLNGAYQDMLAYLDKEPGLPTAFFVDNDMIALGAMKALQERGYKVPDDVSIIGFDDLPFSCLLYTSRAVCSHIITIRRCGVGEHYATGIQIVAFTTIFNPPGCKAAIIILILPLPIILGLPGSGQGLSLIHI